MLFINKKSRTVLIALIIIFLLATCFCGYKIFGILRQYYADRSSYNELSTAYAKKNDQQVPVAPQAEPDDEEKPVFRLNETSPLAIDFDTLQADVNREIVAWLYCEGTKPEINYPVVHHTDDFYYLNHNAKGEAAAAGAIFVGASNFSNFSDVNTIVHGHHLYDGSMFGNLGKWGEQEFFDEHRYFYLNTPDGNYKVEMIAYFVTPEGSRAYEIDFVDEQDIQDWVDWVQEQSSVQSDYEYTDGDQFLTLSTCQYTFTNARGVLIGHMIPIL